MHSQTKKGQKAWEINQPATAKVSHACTKVKVRPFGLLPKNSLKKAIFSVQTLTFVPHADAAYLPLLYTLALQEKGEEVSLFNDRALAGSLTMTSVRVG